MSQQYENGIFRTFVQISGPLRDTAGLVLAIDEIQHAIHLALDGFEAVDLPLDLAIAPVYSDLLEQDPLLF